jgi:hypothetical protein
MSAIYHRFGFYSFKHDEIGMFGLSDSDGDTGIYTFNMGTESFTEVCQRSSSLLTANASSVVIKFCKDQSLEINKNIFNNILSTEYAKSADVVLYPYDGATEVPPVFYEEIPDPLANYSMSGNPLSIQFNPKITQAIENMSLSFIEVGTVQEIEVIVVDKESDVNQLFDDHQYAFFPKERLKYNTSYQATFSYTIGGISKNSSTTFKTDTFSLPFIAATQTNQEEEIALEESFIIHFELVKNFAQGHYVQGISYMTGSNFTIELETIEALTYKVKIKGQSGTYPFTLKTTSGDYVLNVTIK